MEYLFFWSGLAFFVYMMHFVASLNSQEYQRKLNEQREFGYRNVQEADNQKPTPPQK